MPIGRPITLSSNVASKTISITATDGQTLFQPSGGYRINEIAVFRNGTRLVDGQDFTARDGSSVTLLSGATVGDVLEFQIFDSFNIANTIKPNESTQTINGALVVPIPTLCCALSNSNTDPSVPIPEPKSANLLALVIAILPILSSYLFIKEKEGFPPLILWCYQNQR